MNKQLLMGVGVSLALIHATTAQAQIAPFKAPGSKPAPEQHSDHPTPPAAPAAKAGRVIAMAEYTDDGGTPRAAQPANIGGDTPVVDENYFAEHYPKAYKNGVFDRIAAENQFLCEVGEGWLDRLAKQKVKFGESGTEYENIKILYDSLPPEVKRATTIMLASQVVAAGALCLLSSGLYCIAAVVTMVGNMFVSVSNKKLTLANIRLSLANIQLTKGNISLSELNVEMSAFWVTRFVPFCEKAGYAKFNLVNVKMMFTPAPVAP